ncbi:MAG: carboxymuconolactone decarboxylase family protein [Dehalococcoidales bacterium]|nr:MAG: carboxymuconolactone decarboxylase family protein [Dehalococcoidales bacterium]
MTNPTPFNWQEALTQNMPKLMEQIGTIRQETGADGALPAKTKTLMMMLGDALLGHAEGVANIARGARAAGATDEEIKETVAIAFMMGGLPALITASNAFRQ